MPYVDEVGSTRTATMLFGALDQLDTARATPSVQEGSTQLRDLLTHAGYSR